MKNTIFVLILIFEFAYGCSQQKSNEQTMNMNFRKLTPAEERVIVYKGTEHPFTGKYNDFYKEGVYECKRCGTPLYLSTDKFKSDCGWPSFDDEIPGAVKRIPDADGMRTEIVCSNCGAHLGHVFLEEGFTPKNTRHCVNSISLEFTPAVLNDKDKTSDTAIFAGGCFWGVEYYMQKAPGVISTEVGYIGGNKDNPTYEEVCSHTTGFAEAIRIVFDPSETSYEKLARLFFEIHDPTQVNRQGPDIGDQYRSEIFYLDIQQMLTAQKLIGLLKDKGYKVATKVTPAGKFWPAENYHQDYYKNNGHMPYCHVYTKRF
jgi:peptide methionine sulfoxide reductase msrA/msrB